MRFAHRDSGRQRGRSRVAVARTKAATRAGSVCPLTLMTISLPFPCFMSLRRSYTAPTTVRSPLRVHGRTTRRRDEPGRLRWRLQHRPMPWIVRSAAVLEEREGSQLGLDGPALLAEVPMAALTAPQPVCPTIIMTGVLRWWTPYSTELGNWRSGADIPDEEDVVLRTRVERRALHLESNR